MNIQQIPAAQLNPAAYNPRKDLKPGDKEYEKLKRSIAETAEAYALPKVPTAAELFNPAFLPARAERSL